MHPVKVRFLTSKIRFRSENGLSEPFTENVIFPVVGSVSSLIICWCIFMVRPLDSKQLCMLTWQQLPCSEFYRLRPRHTVLGHSRSLNLRSLCWNFCASLKWVKSAPDMSLNILPVSSSQVRLVFFRVVMASAIEIYAFKDAFEARMVMSPFAV